MELFVKLSAIAIATAIIGLILKKDVPQIALVLSICACAIILFCTLEALSEVVQGFKDVLSSCGLEISVLLPLVKLCCISCAEKITCELCRDAGERALAENISVLSKGLQLVIILPLLSSILKSISSLCAGI